MTGQVLVNLVVGALSVGIAAATLAFARRAHYQQMQAQANRVDADAYDRARRLYESVITELRGEVRRLERENAELRDGGTAAG